MLTTLDYFYHDFARLCLFSTLPTTLSIGFCVWNFTLYLLLLYISILNPTLISFLCVLLIITFTSMIFECKICFYTFISVHSWRDALRNVRRKPVQCQIKLNLTKSMVWWEVYFSLKSEFISAQTNITSIYDVNVYFNLL